MTDDRLTATAIERTVQHVDPDWTVRAETPVSAGRHHTHRLRVDTGSDELPTVLKASTDDEPFCHEARLLAVLGEATDLPVPSVHGVVDDHGTLPTPVFLMEELPGESVHKSETGTLSDRTLGRIAAAAGRQLAELHDLDAVEEFGVVTVEEGEPLHGGVPAGDPGTVSVESGDRSWADHVGNSFERLLEGLADTRFDDVRADAEALVGPTVERLRADGPFEPVVGRVESSLDNLLVDRDAGSVTGTLDWEFVASMTPANDLVLAEFWLAGGPWGLLPDSPDRRETVRAGLLEGYRDGDSKDDSTATLEELRTHRRRYEALQLLRTMVHFEGMFDAYGATDRERDGAAAVVRERFAAVATETRR